MFRVAGFLIGMSIGFVGLQIVIRIGLFYIGGPEELRAASHGMSVAEYQDYAAVHEGRSINSVCVFGSLLIGGAGALLLNQPMRAGRGPKRGRYNVVSEERLTRDEFHQVLNACVFAPLEERQPEYVRGLAVGRLAEGQPALAKKLDEFDDAMTDALYRDLCRHRRRGT